MPLLGMSLSRTLPGMSAYCLKYSENPYLNSMFDVGSAVTVKALVPLSCYWTIVCVVFWGVLTVTAPAGYRITSPEQLARHLRFNILESGVLCMQLVSGMKFASFSELTVPFSLRLCSLGSPLALRAVLSMI